MIIDNLAVAHKAARRAHARVRLRILHRTTILSRPHDPPAELGMPHTLPTTPARAPRAGAGTFEGYVGFAGAHGTRGLCRTEAAMPRRSVPPSWLVRRGRGCGRAAQMARFARSVILISVGVARLSPVTKTGARGTVYGVRLRVQRRERCIHAPATMGALCARIGRGGNEARRPRTKSRYPYRLCRVGVLQL